MQGRWRTLVTLLTFEGPIRKKIKKPLQGEENKRVTVGCKKPGLAEG